MVAKNWLNKTARRHGTYEYYFGILHQTGSCGRRSTGCDPCKPARKALCGICSGAEDQRMPPAFLAIFLRENACLIPGIRLT